MKFAWQKLDEARKLLFEAKKEIRLKREDNKDLLDKLDVLDIDLAGAAFSAHERSL